MQRRQFLKAALGSALLPFVPIPAPAAPKPLTMEVVRQAVQNVVKREVQEGTNTITTLDGIFKRCYAGSIRPGQFDIPGFKL